MKRIIFLMCSGVLLFGCAKSFIKPRSTIVEEAKQRGVELPTPEEERNRFSHRDIENQEKLISLLTQRAESKAYDGNYRIGSNDEIEITVFDVPEMNLAIKVRDSGFVNLPLIGGLKAAGRTESEIQDELTKRLKSFIKDPQVNVYVSKYSSQRVAVIGAVEKPGSIALKKGSNSLLELISTAGGLTQRAGGYITFIPAEATGISGANEIEARARLALASYQTDKYKDTGVEVPIDQVLGTRGGIPLELPVRGGDMIVVPESGNITVDGEVLHRGTFSLGQRMTLLGALGAAQGISYSAKVDEVEIIRDIGEGKKARLLVDLEKIARGEEQDVRLRDGDIVVVPSDYGRRLRQDTFEAVTGIVNFGVGGQYNMAP